MRHSGIGLALLLAACASSHGTDGGVDAGTDGSPPSECGPCDQPCCTRAPSSGATVDPFCPPSGFECEGPPISCEDRCPPAPPGCTLLGTPPSCDCTLSCPEPEECAGLSETACWRSDACAPVYDDDCCPSCRPVGGCADCVDPAFFACVRQDEACGPAADPCGAVPSCGPPVDCTDATPNLGLGSCSVAGCVPAVEAGCLEACLVSCRPVTGDSCEATCEIVEPSCPDGMIAEAAGGCYTGFCIPAEVCGR